MTKVYVSIATYGTKNFPYLNKVIDTYKSMTEFECDIYVTGTSILSRPDITFITKIDPKNTVFFHRSDILYVKDNYDLFIFTEDDILITEEVLKTFCRYDSILPIDTVLGQIRFEYADSNRYLIDIWPYINGYNHIERKHFEIQSHEFFTLKNPHQSSWILTKEKLKHVIDNTEFVIEDTSSLGLESGATSIYSNWEGGPSGIIKKVYTENVTDLENSLIEHLPGNHCNGTGVNTPPDHFKTQVSTFISLVSEIYKQTE
jgi:hypothetical protein